MECVYFIVRLMGSAISAFSSLLSRAYQGAASSSPQGAFPIHADPSFLLTNLRGSVCKLFLSYYRESDTTPLAYRSRNGYTTDLCVLSWNMASESSFAYHLMALEFSRSAFSAADRQLVGRQSAFAIRVEACESDIMGIFSFISQHKSKSLGNEFDAQTRQVISLRDQLKQQNSEKALVAKLKEAQAETASNKTKLVDLHLQFDTFMADHEKRFAQARKDAILL
ncbi:unnamed protein product [Dovyalis caffra]|uniref:Uncharacterized protein n=1 Tax=Dovyalis caffra TaxID=77055 RepID=A0AAV1S9M2_9ROSI|nr:unnamed protein product [Dovyalis caffra]